MPVRSLLHHVWVRWLQLAALQSQRLLLLGKLQHCEPPAAESVRVRFLCVLVLTSENCQGCARSLCSLPQEAQGGERGRAGDVRRTGKQQTQGAEIASEEVHRQNNSVLPAFSLVARRLTLLPIG